MIFHDPSRTLRKLLTFHSDKEIQDIIDKDHIDLPLYLHYEHIPSNFVRITILVSTASIPVERRPLIPIYLENFFNTPIMQDGVRLEYEQVVAKLEKDTVNYNIGSGTYMDTPESLRIRFQVEPEKYEVSIKWIKEFLWSSIFDASRLATTITKMRSDIPDEKRGGKTVINPNLVSNPRY